VSQASVAPTWVSAVQEMTSAKNLAVKVSMVTAMAVSDHALHAQLQFPWPVSPVQLVGVLLLLFARLGSVVLTLAFVAPGISFATLDFAKVDSETAIIALDLDHHLPRYRQLQSRALFR
jgi:hypothetical protein